jgi:hypothetical protein
VTPRTSPLTSPDGVPSVGDVIDEFERALRDGAPRPSEDLLGLLLKLHRNNLEQWRTEDVTRVPDADDATVAAAKRDIDALNAIRHGLVEAVDAALSAAIDQEPSATPLTESPAMVFDRLSVLAIRIHFTERGAQAAGVDGGGYTARLPLLRHQIVILRQALEALFDEVRAGQKRFLPYQSLKLYGSPGSGEERSSP